MNEQKGRGGVRLAEAVKRAYAQGQTDYNMEPLVRVDEKGKPLGLIKDKDTVVFCCRRGEREVELTEMFTEPDFAEVERRRLEDLHFVILTMYHEKFKNLPIAFAPDKVQMPLAQVISEAGRSQLHAAESEKFAHVTFFFNGSRREPYPGEEDIMVPSPKNVAFDQVPELSLPQLNEKVISNLGRHDFIVVNYANGDVIGHTSNSAAKVEAAGHVSRHLKKLVEAAEKEDYVIMITADHGNIEKLYTESGSPDVSHTTNLVPFMILDPRRTEQIKPADGSLCDVAPTVLSAMGIEKPQEMSGRNLAEGADFGENRRVLLIILDGWGLGAADDTNPIYSGDTPYWDFLMENQPYSKLHASGSYVGLGEGKAGNSEAGHMNLGAGRVVPQDDIRLDKAIEDGSFGKNPVFLEAIEKTEQRGGALHVLAYLTHKSSHGSIEYALAVCRMAKKLKNVYLHIIFDGRSTEPGSAPELLNELDKELDKIGVGEIVGGAGRGILLERDHNYAKVKLGYDAMVEGKGKTYF